jgi:hypothetical protein
MLYVEFTHSRSFETFVRCHIHAFHALRGVTREIVYDNLATAVAEHDWRLVVFFPAFSVLLVITASFRAFAIRRADGRKARWSARSAISAKAFGRWGVHRSFPKRHEDLAHASHTAAILPHSGH